MADEKNTVSITFTETKIVQNEHAGTDRETRFEAGKTYELSPRSADRWVKRGVAGFASDDDAARAAGASSDVALRIQDEDRRDTNAVRGPVTGTGTAIRPTEGGGGDGNRPSYEDMSGQQLRDEIKSRGIKTAGATRNDQFIKLLERNDTVKAAIASKDYEILHLDELDELAEERNIDLAGKSNKADKIAAIEEAEKAPAA